MPGAKTKAGRFKAAVKKIVLGTAETKRRFVPVAFDGGSDMVVTAVVTEQENYNSGLWVNSTASGNTLARPDTALLFPPNCIFGAIAKGDNSNEREGDNVDLIYVANKYTMILHWNPADVATVNHQRIVVLEFLVCWKIPTDAIAAALALASAGDDYNDNIFRILMAAGLFDRHDTLTAIQGATLTGNSLAQVSLTSLEVLKSGVKQWVRDQSVLEVDEIRDAKAMGSVMKHKWHTFRRPNNSYAETRTTWTTPTADITGNLSATATIASFANPAVASFKGITTQLKRLGFKMHFKSKPIKLKYLISADGSETTASLPLNKTLNYGCMVWSNDAAGATFKMQRGGCEMRWKDP